MGLRERERGEGVITLFCGEEDDDFLVEGVVHQLVLCKYHQSHTVHHT